MKKALILLFVLITYYGQTFGQGDTDIPAIENFENSASWPWAPWINASNISSHQDSLAAHTGKFGLRTSGDLLFRTDSIIGTPGQVISWWIRFGMPTRVHCGFGISAAKGISAAFYLCVDPSTNTLH